MKKIRLLLMCNGKTEYDFYLEIEKPNVGEEITLPANDGELTNYEVVFVQHVVERNGEFRNIIVTAVREEY